MRRRCPEKIDQRFFVGDFGASLHWSVTTVFGQGDASYVSTPVGWGVGWLLGIFGVAIVATITGALVGFVIDFLLKEGQGMGASGYRDHILICGWNSTARDLITELSTDAYQARLVLLCDLERNPAGDDVYFVRGVTSNEADMTSILTVLAIESIAPGVRTVVEVNNPDHAPHLRRANVDELMATSKPPDDVVGFSIDDVARLLRKEHCATLLAVNRNGHTFSNLPTDFRFEVGDDLIVVAESLGRLHPLQDSPA